MLIDEHYIQLGTYAVIAIFLLLQWFMSVRPWFIWGLILPLLFGAAWFCVVAQPLFFADMGFTPESVETMSHYCKLGIIASLALFAVCRIFRLLRRRHKEKKREQRLEEKQERLIEEYISATQMMNMSEAEMAAVAEVAAAAEAAEAAKANQGN